MYQWQEFAVLHRWCPGGTRIPARHETNTDTGLVQRRAQVDLDLWIVKVKNLKVEKILSPSGGMEKQMLKEMSIHLRKGQWAEP